MLQSVAPPQRTSEGDFFAAATPKMLPPTKTPNPPSDAPCPIWRGKTKDIHFRASNALPPTKTLNPTSDAPCPIWRTKDKRHSF